MRCPNQGGVLISGVLIRQVSWSVRCPNQRGVSWSVRCPDQWGVSWSVRPHLVTEAMMQSRRWSCLTTEGSLWSDEQLPWTQAHWMAWWSCRTDTRRLDGRENWPLPNLGRDRTHYTYVCMLLESRDQIREERREKGREEQRRLKERRERRNENSADSYLWMLLALRKESVASQSNRGTRWWWRKRSGRPRNWGFSRATPSSTVNVPTTSTLNPALRHHYIIDIVLKSSRTNISQWEKWKLAFLPANVTSP